MLIAADRCRSSLAATLSVWALGASVALVAGCGDNRPALPWLMAGVGATWSWEAKTPAELGYTLAVVIKQRPEQLGSGECADLPASVQVTVNGAAVTLNADAANCAQGQLLLGPFLHDQSAQVEVRDGNEIIAEGTFANLMPGVGASLANPADGRVRSGDEVVMVPPFELPTSEPLVYIFPTGDPQRGVTQLFSTDLPQRLADGIHFHVPAFVGGGMVVAHGMPYTPDASVTCAGFGVCVGDADNTVGPIFITEGM